MVGDRAEVGRQGGVRSPTLPANDYHGVAERSFLRAQQKCRVTPVAARRMGRDGGR
jgi:hypothetical protein